MTVDTYLKQARTALAAKAYREAHAACLEALKVAPRTGEAFYLLGVLTSDHDNPAKAIDLFDRALACQPSYAEALAQKARSLLALNRRDEAIAAVDQAADCPPLSAHTLDTLGVVLSRAGLHEKAVPFYRQAVEKRPDEANFQYNLAAALQFLGQLDEAREAYRAAIRLNPDEARAYAGLVTITRQTSTDNEIGQLEELFPKFAHDPDAALNVGHAIAKAYEDLSRGAEALSWLHKAKAAKRRTVSYDRAFNASLFAAAAATLREPLAADATGDGPVFVVGMPRTGTTLVDRILSSHSAVASVGELADFGILLKRAVATPGPFVLDAPTLSAARTLDLSEIGRAYEAQVRHQFQVSAAHFVDKMPLNVMYAPLLLRALPNARVVCLKRHPADTVLSNYRQLFATRFSYYDYAYDLEETARYYVAFRRLTDEFEAALPPGRFRTIEYEAIVQNIEVEARGLLDFVGLPFEQACIDFHTNSAPVATASSVQVRQPLYRSALARWKRYRPGLDPALGILIDAGMMSENELTD